MNIQKINIFYPSIRVVSDNTAIEDNENDIEEDLDVSYICNAN